MDNKSISFHFQSPRLEEAEAEMVAGYLDGQIARATGLFFNEAVHNWDSEAGVLSGYVVCSSERVALDALSDAVKTARDIHGIPQAA